MASHRVAHEAFHDSPLTIRHALTATIETICHILYNLQGFNRAGRPETPSKPIKSAHGVASLKQKHPGFEIWSLLEDAEIIELIDGGRFTPKAYAEKLVLRKFGNTSRATLKKDRKKLRKAAASAARPYPSVPG